MHHGTVGRRLSRRFKNQPRHVYAHVPDMPSARADVLDMPSARADEHLLSSGSVEVQHGEEDVGDMDDMGFTGQQLALTESTERQSRQRCLGVV